MPRDFDDATLMAFGDGVLQEPDFSAVAEALEQDQALAARLEALMDGRRLVRELHAAPPEVPEALRRKVEAMVAASPAPPPHALPDAPLGSAGAEARREAQVIPLRPRSRPQAPTTRPGWRGAAIAAGLAAIIAVPALLQLGPGEPPRHAAGPTVLALGQALPAELARAMERVASGEAQGLPDGRRFQAIASFRDAAGQLCREFQLAGGGSLLGIACRGPDAWQPSLLLAMPARSEGGFAPAGSAALVVDAFLESRGFGAPLEPAEEAAALSGLPRR